MVTPVQLGSGSRPATVSIGGSSGYRSTSPAPVSYSTPSVSRSYSAPSIVRIGGSSGVRSTSPVTPTYRSTPSVPLNAAGQPKSSTPTKSNYSVPSVPRSNSSSTPKTASSSAQKSANLTAAGTPKASSVPSSAASVVMKTGTLKNYNQDTLAKTKSGEVLTYNQDGGGYATYKNIDDKTIQYQEYNKNGKLIASHTFGVPSKSVVSTPSVSYTSKLVSAPSSSPAGNQSVPPSPSIPKENTPTSNELYRKSLYETSLYTVPTPSRVRTKIERLNQDLGDWDVVSVPVAPSSPDVAGKKISYKSGYGSIPVAAPGGGGDTANQDEGWWEGFKKDAGEMYDEYAPARLKETVNTISDAVGYSDEEEPSEEQPAPPSPSPDSPSEDIKDLTPPPLDTEPVLPEPEEKKDPIEKALDEEADTPVEFTYSDDDQYLETDEEIRGYIYEWLNSNKERYGLDDSDVEVLTKYFYPFIPGMSQNDVDFKALADAAHKYEFIVTSASTGGRDDDLYKGQILMFQKESIDAGVPAIALGMFNAGISSKFASLGDGNNISPWMSGEGFPEDQYSMAEQLNNDYVWRASSGAGDFLNSPAGMACVGGGLLIAGAVGTFMSGGATVALAGMGTAPFAVTELWQNWGENAFKTKQNLQLAGNYARDHSSQWDQVYNAANDAIKNVGMSKDTTNGAYNLKRIRTAQEALDIADENFKNEAFYLLASGEYQAEMDRLKLLHDNLENGKTAFDDNGAYIARNNPPRHLIAKNIPDGVTVSWNGEESVGGEYDFPEVTGAVISSVMAKLPDGTEIPLSRSLTISPYDPEDKQMDIGALINAAQKSTYKGSSSKETVYTIDIPAGATANVGGTIYKANEGPFSLPITAKVSGADSLSVTISKPGQKEQTRTLYATDDPEARVSFALGTDPYSSVNKPITTFVLATDPSTVVTIDGKSFQRTATANKISVSTPGYHHVKVVAADGSTWEKDVYIADGASLSIPDPVTQEPKQEYEQYGGGGGGGGGYSGGGGGGGSYGGSEEPEPEQGLIIYGPTCEGAECYQDEVRVYPVIGETYGIEPGYHSIKLVRKGKKPWLKTVYCAAGDTITVSPAFEDDDTVEPSPDPTGDLFPKRVFVNSDPSGARVLLNGGATGQWTPCFFDLPKGLYKFTIEKSGYEPYDIICWVGSVIAWNEQAISLSELEGAV